MLLHISLHLQQLCRVAGDDILLRETQLLQLLRIRRRHLRTRHPDWGRLQIIEAVLARQCHDFSADAEAGEIRCNSHQMARLLDRLDDGFDVHGLDGAEVDDFGFDAVFLLQVFGDVEGLTDGAGDGDDGEVFAGPLDLGFTELGSL